VSGIAFDRHNRNGNVVFNARYLDYNDQENADTIDYLDTRVIWEANQNQFIDKPVCAAQLPSGTAHTIDIDGQGQIIPVSNVYIAYTVFTGNYEEGTLEGQIWFQRSLDSGETWEDPVVLSSGHLDQGASIATDPRANGHVVVSWRRFERTKPPYKQNEVEGDAIMAAVSTNAGADFSQVVEVASFAPGSDALFDQPTQGDGNITSFRANAYPYAMMDGQGNSYIVYPQRESGSGWARIMITTAGNDFGWSVPKPALMNEDHPSSSYHQFWPVLAFSADTLILAWCDQRFDRGLGDCSPNHNYLIEDSTNDGCMHALDYRVARAEPSLNPVFSKSVQVSRYPFKVDLNSGTAEQLQDNWANLRLYNQGWWAFNGDYMGITPSQTYIPKANGWIYNSNPNPGTIFHVAWTDNRDVNVFGEFTNPSPPNVPSGLSQFTNCEGVGVRNQNIYAAPVSMTGIVVGSPANTKPLDIRRAFVVIVRNTTEDWKNGIRLEIDSTGPQASFWKAGQEIDGDLIIDIPPYSTVANTIIVQPHSNPHVQLTINVIENGSVVGQAVLNPDKTNPEIQDPVDNPAEHIWITEIHTPSFINYWTYEDLDPNIIYFNNYGDIDKDIINPDHVTPHVINPHVINPHVINPHVINPHVINLAPSALSTTQSIQEDVDIQEAIFEVTNYGNTTSSYSLRTYPLEVDPGVFEAIKNRIQILVAKVSTTPSAIGCDLAEEEHHELVANVTTPHVINTAQSASILDSNDMEPVDSDFYLNPGERAYIIYRVYIPSDVNFDITSIFPNLIADAADGNDGTIPSSAILIDSPTLLDGVVGQAYPSPPVQFVAEGLVDGLTTWSFETYDNPDDPRNPPDWLDISEDGWLSQKGTNTPDAPGIYQFTVKVTNSVNGQVKQIATRTFSIRIVEELRVVGDIPQTLPEGYIGWPYSWTLQITGGVGPYAWSVEGEFPQGLIADNGINGTPETVSGQTYPKTYENFIIKITDQTDPPQEIELDGLSITIAGIKKFGEGGDQETSAIVLDDQGNIYIAGYTTAHQNPADASQMDPSRSDKDFYTAKFTSGGALVWERTYDGTGSGDDVAVALAVLTSGHNPGVYVTGPSEGEGSFQDYVTIRYSHDPNVNEPIWLERYIGPGNGDDIPVDIIAKGGHVCVTGSSESENTGPDFYTVIYNAVNGNTEEEARYDGPSHMGDFPEKMILDSGDIYITGWLHRGNKTQHADYVTVKYDRYLNEEWENTWDSRRNGIDKSYDVTVDSSGNAIVTGESQEDLDQDYDYLTVKYNISGKKLLWDAREDYADGDDVAIGVAFDDSDGSNGIYVVGHSADGTERDFYIVAYDSNGNRISNKSVRIIEPGDDYVTAMATSTDSSGHFCIYLTGYSIGSGNTDVFTAKFTPATGDIQHDRFDIGANDQATSIVLDDAGNAYVSGYTQANPGDDKDFFILKYGPTIGSVAWKFVK
jgi:hypothetical protein